MILDARHPQVFRGVFHLLGQMNREVPVAADNGLRLLRLGFPRSVPLRLYQHKGLFHGWKSGKSGRQSEESNRSRRFP